MDNQLLDTPDMSCLWTMHFDRSKRREGAGTGVILMSPQGDEMRYVIQMQFHASNNEAEYEALLHGKRMAKACGTTRLGIYHDSKIMVDQTEPVRCPERQHDRLPQPV